MSNVQEPALQQLIDEAELQKLTVKYAIATDSLGSGDPARVALGRSLYKQIFASDAEVMAGTSGKLIGPEAWAEFVIKALEPFSTTQHLVGSIHIEIDPAPPAGGAITGKAKMSTYLHATHEHAPGGDIWIVLGTYLDEAVKTSAGWQISQRTLVVTSSELRGHDEAARESA